MSPNSASRAEKLGYTNVKVYHEGLPEWSKRNYQVLPPRFLKEAWIDKEMAHVLLDVRSLEDAAKGFIKGAVSLPADQVAQSLDQFPPKDKKPPIIIYDQNGGDTAKEAAMVLVRAGYTSVEVLTGGLDGWTAAAYTLETGTPSTKITYVPKPRPGEIPIADFKALAAAPPADTLILDVRNRDEANAGMLKEAKLIPEEEILDRGMNCLVTATTCLKQCEAGPIMVVQPENWWFKGVDSHGAINTILDGIEAGAPAAEYLIG